MDSSAPPRVGAAHDQRLDGWKAIAAHVGRGVRTAQRWERELGMPVHRFNTGGGEVVYALRGEIDAWVGRQSRTALAAGAADDGPGTNGGDGSPGHGDAATVPGPARQSRRMWLLATLALVAPAVVALPWYLTRQAPPTTSPAPAPMTVSPTKLIGSGNVLTALGPNGETAFTSHFETRIEEAAGDPANWAAAAQLVDFDGDSRTETLFARQTPEDPAVYLLDSAGQTLWRHQIARTAKFGDTSFGPPWTADRVFFAPGGRSVAVAFHVPTEFAAVIQELDFHEKVLGEYWSNGYVTWFSRRRSDSRTLTFVGAASHDIPGGSLAIFEGPLAGSAPAIQRRYRCSDCPEGGPAVYLVFPLSRQLTRHGSTAPVMDVDPVGPDEFRVRVTIGHSSSNVKTVAFAYYSIDRHGRVLGAELGPEARAFHEKLEADGQETAATRFRKADLWPVHRWNGAGFDVIKGPESRVAR